MSPWGTAGRTTASCRPTRRPTSMNPLDRWSTWLPRLRSTRWQSRTPRMSPRPLYLPFPQCRGSGCCFRHTSCRQGMQGTYRGGRPTRRRCTKSTHNPCRRWTRAHRRSASRHHSRCTMSPQRRRRSPRGTRRTWIRHRTWSLRGRPHSPYGSWWFHQTFSTPGHTSRIRSPHPSTTCRPPRTPCTRQTRCTSRPRTCRPPRLPSRRWCHRTRSRWGMAHRKTNHLTCKTP